MGWLPPTAIVSLLSAPLALNVYLPSGSSPILSMTGLWMDSCFTIQILFMSVIWQEDWGRKQPTLRQTPSPTLSLNPLIRVSCSKMTKRSGFLAPTLVKCSVIYGQNKFSVMWTEWSVHLHRWATWDVTKGVHLHAKYTFTDYSENQSLGEAEGWVVKSQPCRKECKSTGWENGWENVKASLQETGKENFEKAKIQSQNSVRLRL